MSVSQKNQPLAFYGFLGWIVTLLVPAVVALTALRALLFPSIIPFEYNMPNFPADPYGFTKEDRIKWASISLEYFVNTNLDVSFIEDLRFADGTPVYNDREIPHFQDARVVLKGALQVWYVSGTLLLLLSLWAGLGKWWPAFRHGLGRGGWLTLFLIAAIIFFAMLGFRTFFIAFHNIFFKPGTWMFYYSDTFIRLFPERFWFDMFLYIGAITVGLSLLIIFLTRGSTPRRNRSAQKTTAG
jgi:integral membrane protein (TIGR01906 family)